MFKLDNDFLVSLGLGALPAEEKNKMLAHIYETLEMRVGMKLAEQMSDDQLKEFEKFIDMNDEAGALKWLETNFPDYKQVVADELEKLKNEISQVAPQILAQAGIDPNAPPTPAQPQPAAAPQPPQPAYPQAPSSPGQSPSPAAQPQYPPQQPQYQQPQQSTQQPGFQPQAPPSYPPQQPVSYPDPAQSQAPAQQPQQPPLAQPWEPQQPPAQDDNA